MTPKEKSNYLKAFIELGIIWLKKPEASVEFDYLSKRVPNNFESFQFCYFPSYYDSMINFIDELSLIIKADPIPILEELGIIYITEKYNKIVSFFKNNTALIPFFDVYGNVKSISGRSLLPEEELKQRGLSKYKHLPFIKRNQLFGLNLSYIEILKKDKAVIVEGQIDFISTYINGVKNSTALCGSKFTFEQIMLLKRFTNNFYLLLDNDEAGSDGFEKLNKSKAKYELNVFKLELPKEYHDVDDFVKNGNDLNSIIDI